MKRCLEVVVTVITPLRKASSMIYSSRNGDTLEKFREYLNSSLIP